jgi:two-component system KDP operon response regulator KdpE
MSRKTLLAIDDEPQIQRLLKLGLSSDGFKVVEARTGEAGLRLIERESFDIVLLDLGLPDGNGLDVLEAIRKKSSVPMIVLSARDDEAGKVQALDLGADDYLTKPFGIPELEARIRVALRHRLQAKGAQPVLRIDDVEIDLINRRVRRGGRDIQLSPTEYGILRLLAEHPGKILTHQFILRGIRGDDNIPPPQYLRVYIRSLRQKLGDKFGESKIIRTEMGVGYRLMLTK